MSASTAPRRDQQRSHIRPSRASRGLTRREFLLASAAVGAGLLLGVPGCGWRRRRPHNLVLVVIDTLRADYVGAFGSTLPTTPALDAFARGGTLFENTMACAPVTGAAHASLLTGTYATRHGIANQGGAINPHLSTLAQVCQAGGYRTAAFVSNPALAPEWLQGIERGFETFDAELPSLEGNARKAPYRRAPDTAGVARDWLSRNRSRPFFLWVHFQEPHGPYEVPDTSLRRKVGTPPRLPREPRALPVLNGNAGPGGIPEYQVLDRVRDPREYRARYAARTRYVDEYVGRVLEEVQRLKLQEDTVVAVVADHGELLGEHDYYFQHAITLLRPVLHVPFMVAGPGIPAGRRVPGLTGGADVMPTLLDLIGLGAGSVQKQLQGESLASLVHGAAAREPRPRYATCEDSREWAVLVGEAKYTLRDDAPDLPGRLVDLAKDPQELRDATSADPTRAAALRDLARRFVAQSPRLLSGGTPPPPLSDEQRQRLKSLGYMK